MNNLSSYCGLVDAKIRASDKDLPVSLQLLMHIMAIQVVAFSNGVYKIRKIFAKESTYPKEIFEF